MIPNIFRDWLGGFYINSSGLISGSDIIHGDGKKETSPAKQTTEVMHIPKRSDTAAKWHWNFGKWNFSGFSFFLFFFEQIFKTN